MAKQNNTSFNKNSRFDKNLSEDIRDYHLEDNSWTQARNAITNSKSGDLGSLGNEPGNTFCTKAPYTIIGKIHLYSDKWVIFSTDNTNSEIGLYDVEECSYSKIVNDKCLGFKQSNLIRGISKENFDCTWQIYWADGLNVDRTLNIDKVPYIQNCVQTNDCLICTDTKDLDCEKLRLSPVKDSLCFKVSQDVSGGTLPNGSYYVVGAYMINGQKIGDYSLPSNIQSLFSHENVSSSLKVDIINTDKDFEEFELVMVSITNQQTVARRIGIYPTTQKVVTIDIIDNRYPIVPIEQIPLRTPIYDKSEKISKIGDYAVRISPSEKFDFNYQPLANQIRSKWVSVEYDEKYYSKGGSNTGYMRDEVYSFFIRWVWNTGDKSASYHIPGRAASTFTLPGGGTIQENALAPLTADVFETDNPKVFEVYNTAPQPSYLNISLGDGGTVIGEGLMAYHESTESYDNNSPEIWNSNVQGHPEWNLCGKPIRHHKFPENSSDQGSNNICNHFSNNKIRIMGVKFENIKPPVDNQGNIISDIVGYEILRGTREGNRTVIAKGMINNMFFYDLDGDPSTNSFGNRVGLYPNFPFNDLRPDPYISIFDTKDYTDNNKYNFPNSLYSVKNFTFHSPETSFNNPFLSPRELKIYGSLTGQVNGSFSFPEKHPKHKFITDASFFVGLITATSLAVVAVKGKKRFKYKYPEAGPTPLGAAYSAATVAAVTPGLGGEGASDLANLAEASVTGTNLSHYAQWIAAVTAANAATLITPSPTGSLGTVELDIEDGFTSNLPFPFNVIQALPTFMYFFNEGFDATIEAIRAFSPFERHALQYTSHCKYTGYRKPINNNRRFLINDAIYLNPEIQDYSPTQRINNLYRGRTVALDTARNVGNVTGVQDTSKFILRNAPSGASYTNPTKNCVSTAHSHYAGLKQRLRNQYGQLEGITQVPVSTCPTPVTQSATGILFNGDIYIGRFTEKNTMPFFYDWLYDQPDGSFMNYHQKKMVSHPTFWMDTDEYDLSDLSAGISNIFNSSSFGNLLADLNALLPSGKFRFDEPNGVGATGIFRKRNAYMYLFNSGIRDFFVESEINIDFRDYGENDSERHYMPYGKYQNPIDLFDMGIIKSGNFYKYDFSLSVSRLYNNFFSWSNVQDRNYNPQVAEDCYTERKNRVLYSLPQTLEAKKDFWRVYLPNNYKDFKSKVTSIKPIGKNGAMFFFENESPIQFLGVDQLETDAGTKITIGDGGLFSQPIQNLVNTEDPFEYGSCQDDYSVINTPVGLFWMSQNQGKVFRYGSGLEEISNINMKFWFAQFMKYKLLEQFPNFKLTENPVIGIGCQSIYDNENSIVYFCKKDYRLKEEYQGILNYLSNNVFINKSLGLKVTLGDPRYFEDCSWTISFDSKTNQWISYHDWHPDLVLPGKNTFITTKGDSLWLHNDRVDLYCNYYGIDYPFEVEWQTNSPMSVGTLRSVEYYMESYIYKDNEYDRFHVLDHNFDKAVIYNTEQCSGSLRLNLSPKNDVALLNSYPQVNPTSIDILYSKEENKYRFNQFWDITADRGEYNPSAQRSVWNTEYNGYIRNLNTFNLNYNKSEFERKKFRHYENRVLMIKQTSNNVKMLVSLANTKNLLSSR